MNIRNLFSCNIDVPSDAVLLDQQQKHIDRNGDFTMKTALILGARGKFGRNAAHAFEQAGWRVQRFERARDNLEQACRSADVVVNAWNPSDYPKWAKELLPMHQQVLDAMRGTDATVILPANVYVFGAQSPQPWSDLAPHRATNPLGLLRRRMEDAYRMSGIRTIVLRGGDFLDTEASGNWFDVLMVKKLAKGVFTYPAAGDVPHAWAYLPDMAQAAVQLAQMRDDLPRFCEVPFAGYTLTGAEMCAALGAVTGRDIRSKRMNWLPLRLLKPVMPSLRGLCEMRYLWETPHALDGGKLAELLPAFAPTPLQDALRRAIAHTG